MGLASVLGGIAGLLTGGTAMAAAVGAGLGNLAGGGDIEDAVKDAAIAFGIGSIPGVGAFGQKMGSNLGFSSALGKQATKKAITEGAAEGAKKSGFMDFMKSPSGIMTGISVLGAMENKDKAEGEGGEQFVGGERLPDYKGRIVVKPYIDPVTGERTFTPPDGEGIMSTPQASSAQQPNWLQLAMQNPPRMTGIMMANGGYIEGPGTGTSDSIKSGIYQNGQKVQEARLSDGEFVMTRKAVENAGGGDRDQGAAKMYALMNNLERRVA